MLRRCLRRLAHVDPELSKNYHATFHDGAHRTAPDPQNKAWMDRKSPIRRFWAWYAQPVAKGSSFAAWLSTGLVAYYCACVMDDAKSTYVVNTAVQRRLHLQTMKLEESNARLEALQAGVASGAVQLRQDEPQPQSHEKKVGQSDNQPRVVINYELELTKERARANELNERNVGLVAELHNVRRNLHQAETERTKLREDVEKLSKYLKSLSEEQE